MLTGFLSPSLRLLPLPATSTAAEAAAAPPVTSFSANIGSTEIDMATGVYAAGPGSDTKFVKSYTAATRFQGANSKTITVTQQGSITCPTVVDKDNWLSGDKFDDKFAITVAGNQITAKRTDSSGSWQMNLQFKCTVTTAAEAASTTLYRTTVTRLLLFSKHVLAFVLLSKACRSY